MLNSITEDLALHQQYFSLFHLPATTMRKFKLHYWVYIRAPYELGGRENCNNRDQSFLVCVSVAVLKKLLPWSPSTE